jgi:hypothetical protein
MSITYPPRYHMIVFLGLKNAKRRIIGHIAIRKARYIPIIEGTHFPAEMLPCRFPPTVFEYA